MQANQISFFSRNRPKQSHQEVRNQKTPTLNEFVLVPENSQGAEQSLERFSNAKKRKMGTVHDFKKKVRLV